MTVHSGAHQRCVSALHFWDENLMPTKTPTDKNSTKSSKMLICKIKNVYLTLEQVIRKNIAMNSQLIYIFRQAFKKKYKPMSIFTVPTYSIEVTSSHLVTYIGLGLLVSSALQKLTHTGITITISCAMQCCVSELCKTCRTTHAEKINDVVGQQEQGNETTSCEVASSIPNSLIR
jgi:hypothetical protein